MGTSPSATPPVDLQLLRRVRFIRLAAWATVALAGVEAWLSFFPPGIPCSGRPSTAWLLILGMAAAPYVAMGLPGRPRNWRLVLVSDWSWVIVVVLGLLVVVPVMDATPLPSLNALLILAPVLLLLQGLILWNARRALRILCAEPRKVGWLVGRVACTLTWLALMIAVAFGSSDILYGPAPRNYASAVGTIRSLNTALAAYQGECRGFAESLEQLGPRPEQVTPAVRQFDCEHAALIDDRLASGTRSGYRFTYNPGKRNSENYVTSYTITARPLEYGRRGFASVFTDESGVIRKTCEDRAPTAQDEPLR